MVDSHERKKGWAKGKKKTEIEGKRPPKQPGLKVFIFISLFFFFQFDFFVQFILTRPISSAFGCLYIFFKPRKDFLINTVILIFYLQCYMVQILFFSLPCPLRHENVWMFKAFYACWVVSEIARTTQCNLKVSNLNS